MRRKRMIPTNNDELEREFKKGWRGGLADGTPCGRGSTIANTKVVLEWLPRICEAWEFQSVCDAGAGDLHWIQYIDWSADYRPFDVVPRHPDVKELDITKEVLPACDVILCRMVLNHLGQGRTDSVLDLFRQSSKYLIASRYDNTGMAEIRPFRDLDLNLGEPLAECPDGHEPGCYLSLWEL